MTTNTPLSNILNFDNGDYSDVKYIRNSQIDKIECVSSGNSQTIKMDINELEKANS